MCKARHTATPSPRVQSVLKQKPLGLVGFIAGVVRKNLQVLDAGDWEAAVGVLVINLVELANAACCA